MNPANCPLCGEPNRCAMALEKETGLAQPPCWCTTVAFDKAVLAKIPAAAQGMACICAACATKAAPQMLHNK